MRRIVTAWEQAEMLAPWREAVRWDYDWADRNLTPAQQRKQYKKMLKEQYPKRKPSYDDYYAPRDDPVTPRTDWESRPQKGKDDTIETSKESLPQPALPGMEKMRGESTRLWRGVPVDTTDPAFRKVWQMTFGQGQPVDDPGLFPDADLRYEDRGGQLDHPGLADAIMDGFRNKGGVGEHHSTDFDTGYDYALDQGPGSMNYGEWRDEQRLPVLLDSDWNGRGEDYSRAGSGNVHDEHEIMLRHRKAPLEVRTIKTPTSIDSDYDELDNEISPTNEHITAAYWGF